MICKLLNLPYKQYKGYMWHLKYLWRRAISFGLGSKSSKFVPDSQHHVRAWAYVPKCLDRRKDPEVVERAVAAGWVQSKNRNRALIWNKHRTSYGRIEWWETGKVSVHLKKPHNMGRVKRLVSLAFYENDLIFDTRIFFGFVDTFRWAGAHDVYFTPQRLPYKEIRTYEKSGFIIKTGDRSHPHSIEVEWAHPLWAEQLEFLLESFMKNMEREPQPPSKLKPDTPYYVS